MGNRNSGPRPTATAVKLLRGVRKDRINFQEARPPTGAIAKPPELWDRAARVWDELAPLCLDMGTLSAADVRPFALLCELQATAIVASEMKRKPKTFRDGAALEKQVATAIRPYYALFGLDPVSRQRIRVASNDAPPVSKWAGLK